MSVIRHDRVLQVLHHGLAIGLALAMEVKVIVVQRLATFLGSGIQSLCHVEEVLFEAMVRLDQTQIDYLAVVVVCVQAVEVLHHGRIGDLLRLVQDDFKCAILKPEER